MAVSGGRRRVGSMLPYLVKTLRKESTNPANQKLPSLRRMFSLYDQINLIDSVPEGELRFKWYSDTGFTVNDVKYEGSLLIVENKVLSWAPKRFSDINSESLSIFQILRPIPVFSVGTCLEVGRPSSGDSEPMTAFLWRFRAPDVLPRAIPSALLHRIPKHSADFQNCSPEIYFKTALSGQQLFNPPELSQTEPYR